MRFIVVDLEATCRENVRDYARMETVEIGAVELLAIDTPPERDFSRFVRPTDEPVLSDFCRRLTTIRQRDVDLGIPLTGTHHRGIDDAWNIARIAVAALLLD